nr:tubulin polyglutamylase TTLL5 isoform X1 [Ciona intestinalis]|eukprot:XP_018671635.1 tubulin polyglutamylase TTLL5 isoform X1 [Ciona intestinalis]
MPGTSEVTSDYSGSITPSTSEEDEEEENEDNQKITENSSLLWTTTSSGSKRCPLIMFRPESLINRDKKLKSIGEKYHLAYKMVKTESKLVRSVLSAYGFHEVHPNSADFNLMWTGAHLKPFSLRSLQDFQKVNHFPRSYEITRKDRLYKNIERMAHTKGFKHFDFIPQSYLMPSEYQEFCSTYMKEKGSWIVKPIASSRGRGIYLINNPNQVPLEDNIMVCKYVSNPLLIDGFKFDVRVYVAITSYDPLLIYMFEEGLTRFATVKYEKTNRHLKNQMMHLTNYSINKKSHDYVRCEDPEVEDYGNKWSMSAMLRYLKQEGIDTSLLMMRIEAVIIKSILAAELPIATACRMFVPHRENCIELYGFDILIDENLKPWILEGNLSPSLACDAPLDLKIKSSMVADFFSLAGFLCVDPMTRSKAKKQEFLRVKRPYSASKTISGNTVIPGVQNKRPASAGTKDGAPGAKGGLSIEEARVLKMVKEQYQRRGSFVRIFPTAETWELYGSFLEYKSNMNLMLAQKLFPDRAKAKTGAYTSAVARMRSVTANQMLESRRHLITDRIMQYERKLLSLESYKRKRPTQTHRKVKQKDTPVGIDNKPLTQGRLERQRSSSGEEDSDVDVKPVRSKTKTSVRSRVPTPDTKARVRSGTPESGTRLKSRQKEVDKLDGDKKDESKAEKSKTSETSSNKSLKSSSNVKSVDESGDKKSRQAPTHRVYMYKSSGSNETSSATLKLKKLHDAAVASKSQEQNSVTSKSTESMTDSKSGDQETSSADSASENESNAVSSKKSQPKKKLVANVAQKPIINGRNRKGVSVLQSLKSGGNLSKVQARQAFSAYLSRVQHRLMIESEGNNQESSETVVKQEEQMELVLRFLKRAAGNLRQSFSVVVPSRRLALSDRKRILAKQLGDFVHIYNKETDTMEHKFHLGLDNNGGSSLKPQSGKSPDIPNLDFRSFVSSATEMELEEVLTTYTHKNKSASVFLGASKPKSAASRGEKAVTSSHDFNEPRQPVTMGVATPRQLRSRVPSLERLPYATVRTYSSQSEEHKESFDQQLSSSPTSFRLTKSSSSSSLSRIPSYHQPPHGMSSIQQAAYIYSSKLTPPSSKAIQRRPASAKTFSPSTSSTSSLFSNPSTTNRPMSAASRLLGSSIHYQTAVNEEAIADALQRLSERQAARQYSASSVQLTSLTQHLSTLSLANMKRPHQLSSDSLHRQLQTNQRASSLSDLAHVDPSVQSMVDPGVWDHDSVHPTKSMSTANLSDGQDRNNILTKHPHILAQQSKELLQQSRAKHQAMVAQAHSIVSHQTDPVIQNHQPMGKLPDTHANSDKPPLSNHPQSLRLMRPPPAPRPPERPRLGDRNISLRKPLTNPRIPNRVGGSGNYYNSLMYDSNTGSTKLYDGDRRPMKAVPTENKESGHIIEPKQPAWK